MRINIALASDNNYAEHMAIAILSILENAKKSDKLCFYILDNGISREVKDVIDFFIKKNKALIKYFDLKNQPEFTNRFENCKVGDLHISITGYYRFMIAELMPKIDKIIYLDCDILVEKSLSDLYKINIDDYYIGAVEDVGYAHWRQTNPEMIHKFFYINSGVLLINAKKWREDNIGQKLLDYAIAGENIGYGQDQPVINVICKEKCLPLDYKWNVQDSFYRPGVEVSTNKNKKAILEAAKNPFVLHFTAPVKPWNNYITLPKGELYLKYVRNTPWSNKYISLFRLNFEYTLAFINFIIKNPFLLFQKKYRDLTEREKKEIIVSHNRLLSFFKESLNQNIGA